MEAGEAVDDEAALVGEDDLFAGAFVVEQAAVEGDDRLDEGDLHVQAGFADDADGLAELGDEDLFGLRDGEQACHGDQEDEDGDADAADESAVHFGAPARAGSSGR